VHLALFQNVTNAAFLRSQLLEANPAFDYAFLDASMVSYETSLIQPSHYSRHLLILEHDPPYCRSRPLKIRSSLWFSSIRSKILCFPNRTTKPHFAFYHTHIYKSFRTSPSLTNPHPQILSPTHLLSASILALHLSQTTRLKARTAHSELVFRLHPNNNIGESYRKFGISDSTSTLIAVKLGLSEDVTNESVSRHLGESVKGESVLIGEDGVEVGGYCDLGMVRKVYKLDGGGGGGSAGKGKKGVVNGGTNGEVNAMDERKEVEAVVLGMMTIKGS
jgi:EKC/KEOPS complex subunit CGI121/TPRKB